MKNYVWVFVILIVLLYSRPVFADSSYVLPYPSFMPGSKFYLLQQAKDAVLRYWRFGSFGQFKYNLGLADKYLVEAKTLFEYKQYLLAYQALKNSNGYFFSAYQFLGKAKLEGKNITEKEQIFKDAALKHKEVLEQVKTYVPNAFEWKPEKDKPTRLLLWEEIDKVIALRQSYYEK